MGSLPHDGARIQALIIPIRRRYHPAKQYAGGWRAERYGGKVVLGLGVLLWSLFTLLTPIAAAGGMIALLITRVLMGMGEGVTFPSIYAPLRR